MVAVVIAVAAVAAMAMTRKPVLFTLPDVGDATGQPVLAVMNPFRDRGPERAAEEVLNGLRRGDTSAALSRISGGVPPEIYENEKKYPLHAWSLVRRNDGPASVELVYRTSRSPSGRAVMPLFVHLTKTNHQWQVTQFIVGY